VPHVALVGEVGVVEEAVAGLSGEGASSVVSEGVEQQLLVSPHVLAAIDCRVLP